MALILLIIIAWCILVIAAREWIGRLPWPIEALAYLVTGIAWIFPLRPLVRWMNTGRWRP
jgi:hypothetical protein